MTLQAKQIGDFTPASKNKFDARGVKAPVAVFVTTNLTLSGEQTIQGVLTSASRVFAAGQTDPTEVGIYVTDAGAWVRATDFDNGNDLLYGAFCIVLSGTYAGRVAQLTTTGSIAIDTTELAASVAGAALDAATLAAAALYTPADATDWFVAPTTIAGALDELASRLTAAGH